MRWGNCLLGRSEVCVLCCAKPGACALLRFHFSQRVTRVDLFAGPTGCPSQELNHIAKGLIVTYLWLGSAVQAALCICRSGVI